MLFKSKSKWTPSQITRAELLFNLFPSIKKAYELSQGLCYVFENNKDKNVARLKLAQWDEKVRQAAFKSFNTIARTMSIHYKTYSTILTTEVQMLQQNLLMPK